MTKPRVVLTRRWPASVEAQMGERYEVEMNLDDRPFDAATLRTALRRADALCPTVSDRLDASVLEVADRRAKLIANYGVGFNHIDVAAATRAGIAVTNTPGVLTDCTADLTLTLILMLARRAGEGERELRAGRWAGWRPTHLMGTRVTGKTLGLIGFGRIAQAVARRAHFGFGMRVLFHTPRAVEPALAGACGAAPTASLEALLSDSDVVSLHCPGGAATRHLLNAARLALMPPHAFLINTARGEVIDEDALIAALRDRRIKGAGLDVYSAEPAVPPALLGMENVVLLPHLGSATEETRVAMGLRVLANLDAFFSGRPLPDPVS